MPSTINGIGTWYWGKDRIHRRAATCEFCGNGSQLSSYDTTLFFVVIYVPIIPLGRKRVINECGHCRKHLCIPLRKWVEAQEKDILAANQAAAAEPHNEQKAQAAIATAVGYHAREEFLLFADKFGRQFPRSPDVLNMIGDGHAFFGMPAEAMENYLRSLQLKDDPAVHEATAVQLIRGDRPNEARPHVQHILDQKLADRTGLLSLLVCSFQANAMHQPALDLIDATVGVFPALADDKELKKLQAISEKHRTTGKAVRNSVLKQISGPSLKQGGWRGKLPRLIPLTLVAAALAWYVGTAVKLGWNRPVHLINGLERGYTVTVNGRQYELAPRARQVISVADGDVTIQLLDPNLPKSPRTFPIRTSFFKRPFDSTIHVINPDGSAVLYRQNVTYASVDPGKVHKPELFVGQFHYAIQEVDYEFEPLPQQIRTSDRKETIKSHLDVLDEVTPADAVSILMEKEGPAVVGAYIQRRLEYGPEDATMLMIAVQLLRPEQIEKLFESKLGIRPVMMEWHRAYQELTERAHPERDLQAMYETLLAAESGNPELAYLLGRVTSDRNAARALFARAAGASRPVPYAYHAMGYDAIIGGEFEAAIDLQNKALALAPENQTFNAYKTISLYALGRYPELLDAVRQKQKTSPMDATLANEELYLLVRSGNPDAARRRAAEFYTLIRKETTEQSLILLRLEHDAMLAYMQRDPTGYARALGLMQGPQLGLQRAIHSRNFTQAEDLIKSSQVGRAEGYLLLFLAATEAQNTAAAKSAFDASIREFSNGDRDERLMAVWLSGTAVPTEDQIRNLSLAPGSKKIALAALGRSQPSVRQQCFTLARKLNYDTRFPYQLVDQATVSPGSSN